MKSSNSNKLSPALIPALLLCRSLIIVTVMLGVAPIIHADLNSGLVAFYPFNGNASDNSGNTNNGIIHGAILTTNRFGYPNQAYSFNGVSSYIEVPDNDSLELTNDLTMSFWINANSLVSQLMMSKHIAGPNDDGSWIIQIDGNTGRVVFAATPTFDPSVGSTGTLNTNQWQHVVFTYSRSTAIWKLYLNGILNANGTRAYDIRNTSRFLSIGAGEHPDAPQLLYHFNGIIDDVRIYNRVLSDLEASQLRDVELSIAIVHNPVGGITNNGSTKTFAVTANTLAVNYQWFYNNVLITNSANVSGVTTATLTISNVQPLNTGAYYVVLSNTLQSVKSGSAVLTVYDGDTDGDGLPNSWEMVFGLNPNNPLDATNHPSGDQLTYYQKYQSELDPSRLDSDGDGLSDYDEVYIHHINPLMFDSDSDGVPDNWEIQHRMNPVLSDSMNQVGNSGVTYFRIYQYNLSNTNQLDPRNPFFAPGTSFYEFFNNGQHTNRIYYDRDDRLVGEEFSRGLAIAYKYDGNGNPIRQTFLNRASETNGLPILWQFLNGLTNNTTASGPYGDPDGDGWSNYQEWQASTDPNNSTNTPNSLGNPGTNIASLVLPFTPSNFVAGVGQLDGVGANEIVIGADGNPGTNINFLLVLTQSASGWSTQRVDVGLFGVTSLAIGQPANRPIPAIYAGLRQEGGVGRILEIVKVGGVWQTNTIAHSTNSEAFVLGVRSNLDVIASYAPTEGNNGGLYRLNFNNNLWDSSLIDTNSSHRGLGLISSLNGNFSSVRLLDSGGIKVGNILPLPTNAIFRTSAGTMCFAMPFSTNWTGAQAYAQTFGGNLVTITNAAENAWVSANFNGQFWLGLYRNNCSSAWQWVSGAPFSYSNWGATEPNCSGGVERFAHIYPGGFWNDLSDSPSLPGIVEFRANSFITNLIEPTANNRLLWRGASLAAGSPRVDLMNSTSIYYAFIDDLNANGQVEPNDSFVLAEYIFIGTNLNIVNQSRHQLTAKSLAHEYALALVNYINMNDVFFTGEPDGQLFAWTSAGATNAMQRQLFSAQHAGKTWHALIGVKTLTGGEGLAGLRVDPTNQNRCDVIFWSPQAQLPQVAIVPQTAPTAVVLPSSNPLGSSAVVTVRLWDNEGNGSTPFLQYQLPGSTNWQNATLTALDGTNYNPATRVATLPTGVNHTLAWNAAANLGAGVVTNILLRARAQDFSLVGDWSSPTLFTVNMNQDANTNGIPDWWEQQYFTNLTHTATEDYDHDGFSNYAEYIADTNPNDSYSYLHMTTIQKVSGGMGVFWEGGINATQFLQQRLTLTGTNLWSDIFTSPPPTPNPGAFTNFGQTNKSGFYRVRVTR